MLRGAAAPAVVDGIVADDEEVVDGLEDEKVVREPVGDVAAAIAHVPVAGQSRLPSGSAWKGPTVTL